MKNANHGGGSLADDATIDGGGNSVFSSYLHGPVRITEAVSAGLRGDGFGGQGDKVPTSPRKGGDGGSPSLFWRGGDGP